MKRLPIFCTLSRFLLAGTALLLLNACALLGLYDKTQEPVITVGAGLQPEISWTPGDAWELNVYEGTEDGDGLGAIWNAKMGDGYENSLRSPIIHGVPPEGSEVRSAPPLAAGKRYTVVIHRKDPKRSGDGFTARASLCRHADFCGAVILPTATSSFMFGTRPCHPVPRMTRQRKICQV